VLVPFRCPQDHTQLHQVSLCFQLLQILDFSPNSPVSVAERCRPTVTPLEPIGLLWIYTTSEELSPADTHCANTNSFLQQRQSTRPTARWAVLHFQMQVLKDRYPCPSFATQVFAPHSSHTTILAVCICLWL